MNAAQTTKTNLSAHTEPIVPLLPYQQEDVESADRFRWCCWARQTGKSFTKSLRRILRGIARRRTQIFLSAGERQSRELMEKARQHCNALKIAFDYYDHHYFRDLSVKQLEIVLPGAVRIIGLPANPQTARGYTGDVLLDEFAMHAADRDIWAAMFPSILRGEGELDVASTPKGKQNMFYQLQENDFFTHSTLTLPQAIEQGLDVDMEEIHRAMNDETLFAQEFLCDFLDESTAFLTYDQISACEEPLLQLAENPGDLAEETGDLYVGVDIGRVHDLTVMWVVAQREETSKTVGIFELANAPFREQFDLLSAIIRHPQVRRCCMDAGGLGMQLSEQAVERFGGHRVEAVTLTPAVRSQIASALRICVEAEHIRIPCDPRIRNDWHSVERGVTASGHFRLSAPRREGSHADRFWAAALAVHAAQNVGSNKVEFKLSSHKAFVRQGTW